MPDLTCVKAGTLDGGGADCGCSPTYPFFQNFSELRDRTQLPRHVNVSLNIPTLLFNRAPYSSNYLKDVMLTLRSFTVGKVGVEFYTKDRVSFAHEVEGAKQEKVFG
jgi:hypothetical protein